MALTEAHVGWLIGIQAVAIATIDVRPHRHGGVCGEVVREVREAELACESANSFVEQTMKTSDFWIEAGFSA